MATLPKVLIDWPGPWPLTATLAIRVRRPLRDWQPLIFDFSSAEACKTTFRIGEREVRRQAEKALARLDRLKVGANADFRARIQFVTFLRFSGHWIKRLGALPVRG